MPLPYASTPLNAPTPLSRAIKGVPGTTFTSRGQQLVRLLGHIIANLPNDIQENGEWVARAIEKYKANPLPDNIPSFKNELMLCINTSSQRFHDIQTTFQIFFCRHVDDFQTFLEHILRDIAQFEPSILDNVPIKKSVRELPIDELTSLKLRRLSYLSIREIREVVDPYFVLFPDTSTFHNIERIFALRNLYVHNYGIVDQHFLSRFRDSNFTEGQPVKFDHAFYLAHVQVLLAACTDIQIRAQQTFNICWQDDRVEAVRGL